MLAYYFQLGLLSLRRNPMLTALMVLAIGVGVATSMTTYAVFRAVSSDPMPWKSTQLFAPQVDGWGPQSHGPDNEPADMLGYLDAVALMNARVASRQAASYPISFPVQTADGKADPFPIRGYATYADFFGMFDVPFQYGGGWSAADDRQHADTVVISRALNQQLFAGANSVGNTIRLDDRDYRVVGVIEAWDPRPRFFETADGHGFDDTPPDFFVPFTRAIELRTESNGLRKCNGHAGIGWDGMLRGQCVWISMWVELPDATAVGRYRSFLQGYAAEQQRSGRYPWKPNVRLRNLRQWLDYEDVVPTESKLSVLLALGFLVVCLVNTVGLLLAKFMRRASEIGVRRALGASRREIYWQFALEACAVGLAGGALGLVLTGLGMLVVNVVFDPKLAQLARLDATLLGLTVLVALAATLLAAFYPIWRAARVQPAWQLKSH